MLRDFLEWADRHLGDPLEEVKKQLKGFPENVQVLLVNDALERKQLRKSIQSPEIQALMASPDGAMKIIELLFQKHHPNLNSQQIEDLYETAVNEHGPEYIQEVFARATGTMPRAKADVEKEVMQEKGLLPADDDKKKA